MTETTAPQYVKYVASQRAAGFLGPERSRDSGERGEGVHLDPKTAVELLRVAALRAAGIFRSTRRTTIAWVDGASQLAIIVAGLDLEFADGEMVVVIPVRCDQAEGQVRVTFAVGSSGKPRGLYAATERRPRGPELIVDVWGEALVAFAWQCLVGLYSGMAAATGKDARGNLLVPVEVEASSDGLVVVPMGRHRFYGSSGLTVGKLS